MGDPRKQRRKYSRPSHPWKADRILEENELQEKYGLKNKKEIWRARSEIGRYREIARKYLASPEEEGSASEIKKTLEKLNKQGILKSEKIEDILSLTVESLLERRLQTIVYSKGLANTPKQARQLVVHRHVLLGDRVVDIPRFIVPAGEEEKLTISKNIAIEHGQRKEEESKTD
ncbi:MAG: 30S ribosomal protein S4 [Candidatus Altiarchaeota archaeon]